MSDDGCREQLPKRLRVSGSAHQQKSGAQGRDRTADTAIFSRMLYQLSYLGAPASAGERLP